MGKLEIENNIRKFFEKKSGIDSGKINFSKNEEKLSGVTGAYIADVKGDRFVVKNASYANDKAVMSNKIDTLREYVSAPLFTRALYGKTPTISTIKFESVDGIRNRPRIASSFIEDSRPLSDYVDQVPVKIVENFDDVNIKPHELAITKIGNELHWKVGNPANQGKISDLKLVEQLDNYINNKNNKAKASKIFKDFVSDLLANVDIQDYYKNTLQELSGFEKIIASSLWLGDGDFHGGNILYKDGELFKIDHGKAGLVFIDNEENLRRHLHQRFGEYKYHDKMPLNIEKMQNAISGFSDIGKEELDNMIHARIYSLTQEGFHFPREIKYFDGANSVDVKRKTIGHNYITNPEKQNNLSSGDIAITLGKEDKIICKIAGKDPFEISSIGPDHRYVKLLKEGKYLELSDLLEKEAEVNVEYELAKAHLKSISNNRHSTAEIEAAEQRIVEIRNRGVNDILEFTTNNRDSFGQYYTQSENQQRAQNIGDFYVEKYCTQQQTLAEMNETLGIIAKIDTNNANINQQEWLNGRWFNEVVGNDPIIWAYRNNCQIEGKDPILWAKDNNRKISGVSPDEWLEKNKNSSNKNRAVSLSSSGSASTSVEFNAYGDDSTENLNSIQSFVSYDGDLGSSSFNDISSNKILNNKESFVSYDGDLGSANSLRNSLEETHNKTSITGVYYDKSKKNNNRGIK